MVTFLCNITYCNIYKREYTYNQEEGKSPRKEIKDMDRTTLISKLNEISESQKRPGRDLEINHIDADDLLLEYINDEEVSEAFHSIDKWYA